MGDFKVLNSKYGVKQDGSMKQVEFSPAQIQERYGQPINPEGENKAIGTLDGLLSSLGGFQDQNSMPMGGMGGKNNSGLPISPSDRYNKTLYDGVGGPGNLNLYGRTSRDISAEDKATLAVEGSVSLAEAAGLSDSFITSLKSDTELLAFYIGAMTYGGYTLGDIVADMVRRQKVSDGDTNLDSIAIISPTLNKTAYAQTTEGSTGAKTVTGLVPSTSLLSAGTSFDTLSKTTIYNMPDSLFNEMTGTETLTTDANGNLSVSDADQYQSNYYDIISDLATATTEQERLIAKANLDTLTKQIYDTYGVTLSNNVTTAWSQLESLKDADNARGIEGSGMEEETTDSYLIS